jgi:multidrug efflux pump subunit AcrA (membrane-fusion protein)
MKTPLFVTAVLFLLSVVPACNGTSDENEGHDHADDATQLYTCGMHPEVIEDEPGTCPICGMNLTPMSTQATGTSTVSIDPAVVQNMGVRTAPVQRTTVFRHLRTIGEVEVGEDELSVVNLRFSGWVEKLYVNRTGDPVTKGQRLFDIYSPDLVAAQEEYLLAIRTQGADSTLAASARRKLELWDLAKNDIETIATSGKASRAMPIRAPQPGFVLHKNLVEGARVTAGKDLYRIGNLTQIWVTAEVYEHDAPWVEVGQPAQMQLSYQQGEVLEGEVAYIYPTLETKSRTLKVRLEFDNPGIRLKPGMFATVLIEYRRKDDVIVIPTEAILHSGRRQLVFISEGRGAFTPREVRTGLVGDRHMTEVLEGISEGEVIVTSGQFLIDSESQLQEALQKMLARRAGLDEEAHSHHATVWSCPMHPEILADGLDRCPKCGMDLEEREGTPDELAQVHGPAVAQPGQYTCPMHEEVISDEAGRCPECGMFLVQVPDKGSDL